MKTFNICDYGAKCSDIPQTKEIQSAIDAAFLAGGGRVVVPCGMFLTGGIRIRSNIELYLESGAILRGSRDPEDYMAYKDDTLEPVEMEDMTGKSATTVSTSRWSNGLIRAFDAHHFSVIGEKGSYIDGDNCYDPKGEQAYRGPLGMSFWRCHDIHLEGYTFINSGNWCHGIFKSQNITVRNVTIYGGHDGVDLRTCDNVLLEDCHFCCGDDSIAGFDNNDVLVRNCILDSACQAIRFGGNNVIIENCKTTEKRLSFSHRRALSEEQRKLASMKNLDETRRDMTVVYSYYCDRRADPRKDPEIVIKDCHFVSARDFVRLEFTGDHIWCCNRSLKSFTMENCVIEDIIRPGMMWGDAKEKVHCHFKNVTLRAKKGYGKEPLFVAANFEKIIFENCRLEGFEDPTILVATDDVIEQINSTPITIKKATRAECMEAHPWGNIGEDPTLNKIYLKDKSQQQGLYKK